MRTTILAALAALGLAGAADATTTTIDFSSVTAYPTTPYYDADGFRFTPSVGFFGGPFQQLFGLYSVTTVAAAEEGTVLTSDDHRPFNLDSLEVAGDYLNLGEGQFFIALFPNLLNDTGEVDLTFNAVSNGFSTYTLPSGPFERVVFEGSEIGPPEGFFGGGDLTPINQLDLTPDLGKAQSPGHTPEPATWALMLIGVGLAGASLRRRRHWAGV